MNDIPQLLSCLEHTPRILTGFLARVPAPRLKIRRAANAWSIHEHACHIATGDRIGFLNRLEQFRAEACPAIQPLCGESFPEDHLLNMDLEGALAQFAKDRAELLQKAGALAPELWDKTANHPEYEYYTPYLMLRHRLMHDHLHLYRMQELWLARDLEANRP